MTERPFKLNLTCGYCIKMLPCPSELHKYSFVSNTLPQGESTVS